MYSGCQVGLGRSILLSYALVASLRKESQKGDILIHNETIVIFR